MKYNLFLFETSQVIEKIKKMKMKSKKKKKKKKKRMIKEQTCFQRQKQGKEQERGRYNG